jgi:sulfoxide reductase heme-binding subunit YedZ
LAITSTNAMVRRMGGQRWRLLHRLAYVAATGAVLHFLWLVKADLREPLIYLAILLVLFAARIPAIAERLARLRARVRSEKASAARPLTT